jgi:hypothetical protein
MPDPTLNQEIKQVERDIAAAEKEHGAESPELIDILNKYSSLLRQTEVRVLEAVNVEARVKTIRAKLYAAEAETHKTTITVKKPKIQKAGPGVYVGLLAVFLAIAGLFLDQSLFKFLIPICLLLAIVDVVMTRGQWWRALVCVLFVAWGSWGITSLPEEMLTAASPIDRMNYEINNPELVTSVRRLKKDKQVLTYKLKMGEDMPDAPVDEQKEWGRVFTWQAKRNNSTPAASLSLASMMVPEHIRKQVDTAPLLKYIEDSVLPRVLEPIGLRDVTRDTGEVVEINGHEFVIFNFGGITEMNDEIRGFMYVTKDRSTLVVISAYDTVPYAEKSLKQLEATMNTFRKVNREAK